MGVSIFDESVILNYAFHLEASDGVDFESAWAPQVGQSRIDSVLVTNDDAIDHVVQLLVTGAGENVSIGSVNIPAGQGFGGTPSIDLIAHLPLTVQGGLALGIGVLIGLQVEVPMVGTSRLRYLVSGGYL